jgi:hypothetical protein
MSHATRASRAAGREPRDTNAAMRRAGLCIAWVLVGCRFDSGGVPVEGDDAVEVDAAIDGPTDDLDAPIADAAAPDGAPDATICPMNYLDLGVPGSKYRVVGANATWDEAEADCENDTGTGHLIVLDSAQELAVIDPMVGGAVWTGLQDRVTEGVFLAVTGGTPSFRPFQSGEPNDGGIFPSEDCVELDGAQINDENCGDRQGYICECDALPPDRSTYTPRP